MAFLSHVRQLMTYRWVISRVGLLEAHKMWFWESLGWTQWIELELQKIVFSFESNWNNLFLYLNDPEPPNTSYSLKLDQTVPTIQQHEEAECLPTQKEKIWLRFSCCSFSVFLRILHLFFLPLSLLFSACHPSKAHTYMNVMGSLETYKLVYLLLAYQGRMCPLKNMLSWMYTDC